MATYLGRNVNLALLIIIIGVVVALVGTTVFFQRSLQTRTNAFENTTQTLSECQTALSNYEQQYSAAQEKVNQTTEDIRKYDQLYESKVGELKDAQTSLASLQKQLDFEKLQADKFQQYYEQAILATTALNQSVQTLQAQVTNLNNQLTTCNNGLSSCRSCANGHGFTC